jgi:hypothetical protein
VDRPADVFPLKPGANDHDWRDPAFHDAEGAGGIRILVARRLAWIRTQDADTQARYCGHGRYVEKNRVLAYLCPDCPEVP